jgi:hypothetical protein
LKRHGGGIPADEEFGQQEAILLLDGDSAGDCQRRNPAILSRLLSACLRLAAVGRERSDRKQDPDRDDRANYPKKIGSISHALIVLSQLNG